LKEIKLVDLTGASWNHVSHWLRRMNALRTDA